MRRSPFLMALSLTPMLVALGLLAGNAGAWYPSTVQEEMTTATWCANGDQAYEGIELNKGWFDTHEFNAIRYYSSMNGGALSNPDADARIETYYGAISFPTAIFDGTIWKLGADEQIATGLPYRAIIEQQLARPSYFKITIQSVDFSSPTGSIDLDIEVMEDVPDISNMKIRMALTEDNVTYELLDHQDVTRDMLPDITLTVSNEGQIQNVNTAFSVDPAWIQSELKIVAFVQDDSDQTVHASASTGPNPDYSFRYYALGERGGVGPLFVPHPFDDFRVYNVGNATDTYTLTVAIDGPPGWSGNICDHQSCYGSEVVREVDPGDYVEFHVDVFPTSTGYGKAILTISSAGLSPDRNRTLEYNFVTDDLDILLVDDDGGETYETYFTTALIAIGYPHGVWDRSVAALTDVQLQNFSIILWSTGAASPTVDEADRAALAGYLDSGSGGLFICGQDIGLEMNEIGGDAYQWYQDYLHAIFVDDHTNDYTLDGVQSDPISSELDLVIEGGDGANNQESLNDIDPADAYTTMIWTYDENSNAAIRAATPIYKVVYFAFGFEAIDNTSDRGQVLYKVIDWLQYGSGVDEQEFFVDSALRIFPNPAQHAASVHFTLPVPSAAKLKVFGPDGRLVRTLIDGHMDAGNYTAPWDQMGANSERLPAGVYYCHLETESNTFIRKAVLLK